MTGGAGFIGSHLVEALLQRGETVIALDNFDPFYDPEVKRRNLRAARKQAGFRLIEADIRDRGALAKIFSSERIETIFHGAARAGVRPSVADPLLYADVNIGGTLNLLEAAREWGVEQFVFASSSSVYGSSSRPPFSEDDPAAAPISPYAATKRAGELLCHTYHHLFGIPMTCLRFFTVYGPRQRPEMAIHKFVRLIEEGKPLPVHGDGSFQRDYTYIDDIIGGVLAALDRTVPFEIINLGGSQPISLTELISLIERVTGKRAESRVLEPPPGDVPLTHADVAKAERLLSFAPKVGIGEGIERFVKWFRTERRGA